MDCETSLRPTETKRMTRLGPEKAGEMIIRPFLKEGFRRTRRRGIGLAKARDGKDQMCPESAEAWVATGEGHGRRRMLG